MEAFKLSERETQKSLQARNTDSERLLSAASHVSDEKRKGWLLLILWWLKSRNGLKQLVNKLQNVMFSKTRTNYMYSNSAARARAARVQSPKCEEILRWNTVTHHLLFFFFLRRERPCDTCDKHFPKFVMRYIWEISACMVNKKKHWGLCVCFRQNKSSITIHNQSQHISFFGRRAFIKPGTNQVVCVRLGRKLL